MSTIYRNRQHFAAIIRRARAEGTLTSYDRSRTLWRWALVGETWCAFQPEFWSAIERL